MYIKEVPDNSEIIIHVSCELEGKTTKLHFISKADYLSESERKSIKYKLKTDNFKCIKLMNKLFIDFDSDKVRFTAIAVVNEKAFIYKSCKVRSVEINDKEVTLLISEEDGTKLLRRDTYRLSLGQNGRIEQIDKKAITNVQMRDISIGGISFICGNDYNFKIGDIFSINFKDAETKEDINLQVQVVRIEESNNEDSSVPSNPTNPTSIVGCVILRGNNNIGRYINQKQIERLQRKGRIKL